MCPEWLAQIRENRLYRGVLEIGSLLAALAIIGIVLKAPFTHPELSVTYELFDTQLPVRSAAAWDSLQTEIPDTLSSCREQITQFLNAPEMLRISLANNTSKRITGVDLRLNMARRIEDVALESRDLNLYVQRDRLCDVEATPDGNFRFPHLDTLPARSKLALMIWGSFVPELEATPIEISSSAETFKIRKAEAVTGIALYVSDHLVLICLLAFVVVLFPVLKRVGHRK